MAPKFRMSSSKLGGPRGELSRTQHTWGDAPRPEGAACSTTGVVTVLSMRRPLDIGIHTYDLARSSQRLAAGPAPDPADQRGMARPGMIAGAARRRASRRDVTKEPVHARTAHSARRAMAPVDHRTIAVHEIGAPQSVGWTLRCPEWGVSAHAPMLRLAPASSTHPRGGRTPDPFSRRSRQAYASLPTPSSRLIRRRRRLPTAASARDGGLLVDGGGKGVRSAQVTSICSHEMDATCGIRDADRTEFTIADGWAGRCQDQCIIGRHL